MGRTDLVRFRKTVSSKNPPVEFPSNLNFILKNIYSYPHHNIAHAVRSLHDASSQRAQISAIKLIGVILFDSHKPSAEQLCSCRLHPEVVKEGDLSVCRLIIPILNSFIFDVPDATPGLLSTSLHSLVRCIDLGLPSIQYVFDCFFQSLETTVPANLMFRSRSDTDVIAVNTDCPKLVCQINAAAVMLSNPSTKPWIINNSSRMCAVLHAACCVTDLFIYTTNSIHFPSVCAEESQLKLPEIIDSSSNAIFVESACDSAMKAVQDIFNSFYTNETDCSFDSLVCRNVRNSVECCRRLLQLPFAPRRCSLACAVALVTGHLLLECTCSDVDQLVTALQVDLFSTVSLYPPFSQLSILRAVIEAPIAEAALPVIMFPPPATNASEAQENHKTVFGVLVSLISNSSDVHFRYLAMETVNACLRWLAPSKLSDGCRDIVLSLVYQRWEEPFAGIRSQIRDTMNALVSVDGGDDQALQFWYSMTASLMKSDWCSKGKYAPLCVLVNRIGALKALQIEHNCQSLAMLALAEDSCLTKAVSEWLSTLWTGIRRQCGDNLYLFTQMTAKPLTDALLNSSNRLLRERVGEHLLPVYLRSSDKQCVTDCVHALLHYLSKVNQERGSRIRSSVMIMSIARKQCASFGNVSDSAVRSLLKDALKSNEEDLRSSAFNLIISSNVPTEPITDAELDMVLAYLPIIFMPGSTPSDRSRFKQCMRRFFERLAICQHAAASGTGGWWSRKIKGRDSCIHPSELLHLKVQLLKRLDAFRICCMQILLAFCYPGACFARRTDAMDILTLASTNLSMKAIFEGDSNFGSSNVAALLVGLFDEWERPRHASFETIQSLRPPLPRFSSVSMVQSAQRYALPLLHSPRQNDVDSGALLCRIIFQKFVLCSTSNSNNLAVQFNGESPVLAPTVEGKKVLFGCDSGDLSAALLYAMGVLDTLKELIFQAETDLISCCERGLFHGPFVVLRYILQDFPWNLHHSKSPARQLCVFVRSFVAMAERCLRISLQGVSFEKFNNLVSAGEDSNSVAGEAIFLGEDKKVESTSCFLSAKEVCVSLGVLCHQAPLFEMSLSNSIDKVQDKESSSGGLVTGLDQSVVERIGEMYTFVFTNTRHWGVIDGASEGLQLLCERLLSSSSLSLRALPMQWAMNILSRALSGKLYVLRRSAGIPWLVTAIVNAEASVNRRSHESVMLNGITTVLLDHLKKVEMQQTSRGGFAKLNTLSEESTSHALNLLRALFLNSNIASNIMKYLETATMYCIQSFCSSSWVIRNSAMMLYSALIRRGIGVCRERKSEETLSSFRAAGGTSATLNGTRRLNGTTTFQFFSRHPKLHPFLLEHLKQAVNSNPTTTGSDHPTLYPTLYLLSCLSPNKNEDPTTRISMSKFWDDVRRCSQWRKDYVRRAAAAACVPLIDDCSKVPAVVRDIILSLPTEPQSVSFCNDDVISFRNGTDRSLPVRLEQNRLHGDLLTIVAILENNATVMSQSSKGQLVKTLTEMLPSRTWIATKSFKNLCSVTRAAMVDVLTVSYKLALDSFIPTQITGGLFLICERSARATVRNNLTQSIIISKLGSSALQIKAVLFFGETLIQQYMDGRCNFEECLEMLGNLLNLKDEGLETTMEVCCTFMSKKREKSGGLLVQRMFMEQLWGTVEKTLKHKQRPETIVAGLSLWISFLEFDTGTYAIHQSLRLIGKVIEIAATESCVDIKERALVVLGLLVGSENCEEDTIMKWVDLIIDGCKSHASSLRKAACTSVLKSQCFNNSWCMKKDTMKEATVQVYLSVLSLLEDDDHSVRNYALSVLQNWLGKGANGDNLFEHILPTIMKVYKLLSERYDDSAVLFGQLVLALGNESREDNLMRMVIQLTGAKTLHDLNQRPMGNEKQDKREPRQRSDDGKLFQLEEMCSGGEVILHMHLITWCYTCILYRRLSSKRLEAGLLFEIKALVREEFQELRRIMEIGCENEPTNILDGKIFSVDGFEQCTKGVLRMFLIMRCVTGLEKDQDVLELTWLCHNLSNLVGEHGHSMHPALRESLMAMAEMRRPESFDIIDRRILFLLPFEYLHL